MSVQTKLDILKLKILKIFKTGLFVVFIFLLGYMILIYPKKRRRALDGKETVGVIDEKRMRRISLRYTVENKEYHVGSGRKDPDVYNSIRLNEKFVIKYEKENPKNAIVMYDRPLLSEDESRTTMSTKLSGRGRLVIFEYVVENNTYKRYQVTDMEKPFELAKYVGKDYKVKYSIKDHGIGYIFLDSILIK